MEAFFISTANFQRLLGNLVKKNLLYAPRKKGDFLFYEKIDTASPKDLVLHTNRPVQPLKSFFFLPYQKVSQYFEVTSPQDTEIPKRVILGAKNCDLESLKTLDSVYAGTKFSSSPDPFYTRARDNSFLISSDCLEPDEYCSCTLLGLYPYPEEGFDLNLSPVDGGFIIEVGSEEGKIIVSQDKNLFTSAEESLLAQREKRRADSLKKVKELNREVEVESPYRELIRGMYASPVWKKHSETCVDCGGCNQICPTCRCFILQDGGEKGKFQRARLWDACLLTGFARVAGGANPRSKLADRFSNRLFCKFYFFPENVNLDACTGCGRCISVCPGKIDMRKVFHDLEKEASEASMEKIK
jgi:ferredoxin